MARALSVGAPAVHAETNGQSLGAAPHRSAFSRVRGSLALAVVFAVLAGLFYLVAANGHSGVQVAVASRDLRVGETIDAGAVSYVDVSGSKALLATLLRPQDMASVQGFVLTHAVVKDAAVGRGDVVPAGAGSQARSMSIPVDAEHAAGGTIQVGDTVDVIDGGDNGSAPSFAATGVQVVGVSRPSTGALGGGSTKSFIAVALPDGPQPDGQAALRLAAAIDHAKVEVVRSTGAASLPAAVTAKTTTSSVPGR